MTKTTVAVWEREVDLEVLSAWTGMEEPRRAHILYCVDEPFDTVISSLGNNHYLVFNCRTREVGIRLPKDAPWDVTKEHIDLLEIMHKTLQAVEIKR